MTTTTTRRAILRGAAAAIPAAAVTTSLPALPALAAGPSPIVDLFRRWEAAYAAAEAAPDEPDRIDCEIERRCPPPDVLKVTDADRALELTSYLPGRKTEYFCAPCDVSFGSDLRRTSVGTVHPSPGNTVTMLSFQPWPEREARAAEILAAYGAWQEQRRALEIELGFDQAEADRDAMFAGVSDLERQIFHAPVVTVADAIAKLQAAGAILRRAGSDSDDDDVGGDALARRACLDFASLEFAVQS